MPLWKARPRPDTERHRDPNTQETTGSRSEGCRVGRVDKWMPRWSRVRAGCSKGMHEIMAGCATMDGDDKIEYEQNTNFKDEERGHREDRPLHIEVGEREDNHCANQSPGHPTARGIEVCVIRK